MSGKDWFVIHDGHHIGPFSTNEIREMLGNGHLHQGQLTWKSGMSKWVTIETILTEQKKIVVGPPESNFQNTLKETSGPQEVPDTPKNNLENTAEDLIKIKDEIEAESSEKVDLPPLPELPQEEGPESEEKEVSEEPPPPVPEFSVTPMEKMKLEIKKIQNKDVFDEGENEDHDTKEIKINSGFEFRLIPAAVVLILMFSGVYLLISEMFPVKKGLAGLSPAQRKTMARVFDRPLTEKLHFRYALSRKGDGLWITSNFKRKAKIKVFMQSMKGQVLGEGPVKLSAEAILDGGFAYITRWKVDKGYKVPYGKYLVSLTGEIVDRVPFQLKVFPFLKKFFKEPKVNLVDRGNEILFYPGEIVKFEGELKNYQYNIKKNVLGPLQEQVQRYKSFLGMLNQVSELYKVKLEKSRRGKHMLAFEKEYNTEIGPLLRDLILDCNRKHLSFFNVDPSRAKVYDELVQYGKEVGEIAAVIAKETTSYKKLRKKNRIFLANKYDKKIDEIREKGDGIIAALEEKITTIE